VKGELLMKTFRTVILLEITMFITGHCFGADLEPAMELSTFGGVGVVHQSPTNHGAIQFGIDIRLLNHFGNRIPNGFLFETGYAGPIKHFDSGAALVSTNYVGSIRIKKADWPYTGFHLFFTGGYTRLFKTGNAINYGAGVDYIIEQGSGIRIEARDYWKLSNRMEHNTALRVSYVFHGTFD
jgi:hypothetical protein